MSNHPDGQYKWILHAKDHYSKFSVLWPLEAKAADPIARCFHFWIGIFGKPGVVQCDNGAKFKGAFKELLTEIDFSQNITTKVTIAAVANHTSMQAELGPRCKCHGNCTSKHCACKKAGSACTDRCHRKGKSSIVCENASESGPMAGRGRKRAGTNSGTVGQGGRSIRRTRR
jgi:hypothetical protein